MVILNAATSRISPERALFLANELLPVSKTTATEFLRVAARGMAELLPEGERRDRLIVVAESPYRVILTAIKRSEPITLD